MVKESAFLSGEGPALSAWEMALPGAPFMCAEPTEACERAGCACRKAALPTDLEVHGTEGIKQINKAVK